LCSHIKRPSSLYIYISSTLPPSLFSILFSNQASKKVVFLFILLLFFVWNDSLILFKKETQTPTKKRKTKQIKQHTFIFFQFFNQFKTQDKPISFSPKSSLKSKKKEKDKQLDQSPNHPNHTI